MPVGTNYKTLFVLLNDCLLVGPKLQDDVFNILVGIRSLGSCSCGRLVSLIATEKPG